ncbi:SubName: Full=Uncharacterized protein {ECO:0000313/EMBL:CCA66367.1} [Serendipita indica DSM 11827]|nr:SubName: Full=Uncharacterized protein {ECO:0000313/EMBL:CCA66367.1} [Serendipita indica DSM 11827]
MTLHSGSTRRHGQGAIATRPIQPGQLVHYEEPLVIQEDVRNSQSILSNLCAHPTAFTQAYLNLHNAFVESLPEDPILAIFNSNCLPLAPVEPVSRSLSDENGRILAHGVFLQLSRFNNSCTPNASITWDERRGRMTVHALEPIRAGDELTICYGQPLFAVRNERREYLRHLRNFTCTCACCEREDGDEEARKASDARRTELCRLFKAVPFLGHDAPAGIRARTPPLLDDDSLSSGSAPSTPNRFSTPEPFDPNVLRARLLSAAAEAAAVQQQRSSVVDRHVLDTEMRVGNGTRAETGLVMGGQNQNHDHHHHVVPHSHAYAFDARFSNNTAHEQAAVLPPLILQQRQELLLVQLQQRPGMPPIQKKRKRTESSMSSSLASYSSAAANSTNAKLSVVSSQHHQQSSRFHSHSARQAPYARPSALNQTRPSTMLASDVEMDLADDDDKEREEEQHGCNARLCLNCLVQTADG